MARRQADQALAVPVEPVARLDPPGFDPSREAEELQRLIAECEAAPHGDREIDDFLHFIVTRERPFNSAAARLYTSSIDAAVSLLPDGADWRLLTPTSASAYAASPYNAAAQKRLDGYGKTIPLRICSAALKVRLEPLRKAIATEARRAATVKQGAVHEGAGLKGIVR